MEFNCPDCHTPHEFPDDEIPPSGLVVACTHCGRHIALDGVNDSLSEPTEAGDFLDARPADSATLPKAQSIHSATPSNESSAHSANYSEDGSIDFQTSAESNPSSHGPISLGDADWPEVKDSRLIKLDSLEKIQARPSRQAQLKSSDAGGRTLAAGSARSQSPLTPAEASKRVAPSGLTNTMGNIADIDFGELGRQEGSVTPPAPTTRSSRLGWRFLVRDSIEGFFDTRRLGFACAGVWLALALGHICQWIGLWLQTRVDGLGVLGHWVSLIVFAVVLCVVGAVLSLQSHHRIARAQSCSVPEAVQWVRKAIGGVVGTPLFFLGAVGVIIIGQSLLGLIGRIPFLGPVLWGGVFPITLLLSVLAGLICIALLYSLPVYIPLMQSQNDKPVLIVRRLYHFARQAPLRILTSLLSVIIGLGVLISITILPASMISTVLITRVSSKAMGADLSAVINEVPLVFKQTLAGVIDFTALPPVGEIEASHTLAGLFAGLGSLIMPAIFLGFFLSALNRAGARIVHHLHDAP